MKLALKLTLLALVLLTELFVDAVPTGHGVPKGKCTQTLQRKPWHTLSGKDKKAYIDAELCLMKIPATLGLPGARSRFEELQSLHQIQANITHLVGAFLPFHRLHMHAHEQLLRSECGYQGAQPYWAEERDAGKFTESVVFDPVTGFGGDGVGPDHCIADGPFANFVNNIGPGYFVGTPHCITRYINDTISKMAGREYVEECYKHKRFSEFTQCASMIPHVGGHAGVGGKLFDGMASPGDPLFWLHHTWLDKVFWDWQARDLPARLTDMGYINIQGPVEDVGLPQPFPWVPTWSPPFESLFPLPSSPPEWEIPVGDGGGNVTTLSHVLNMFGVIPNATIRDVMDIRGGLLCYEYVK